MGVEVWPISKCLAQIVESDYAMAGSNFEVTGNWTSDPDDHYSKELNDDHAMIVTNPAATHSDSAVFTPNLQISGDYDVYATWEVDSTNSSEIKAVISHLAGETEVDIDQSEPLYDWFYLGRYSCDLGTDSSVTFNDYSCTISGKVFRVDAVKFVYAGPVSYEPSENSFWFIY